MKDFFEKYGHKFGEKIALEMIHGNLHEVIREYNKNEDYSDELLEIYYMIEDFIKSKNINISNR